MNAIRPYWTLAKREVWEHKSLWIVPIVVACLWYWAASTAAWR